MTHSLFFELLASNEPAATVSIRPATPSPTHTWLYEITETHPPRIFRGTLTWTPTNDLDLVLSVLTDYQAHYRSPPADKAQHPCP